MRAMNMSMSLNSSQRTQSPSTSSPSKIPKFKASGEGRHSYSPNPNDTRNETGSNVPPTLSEASPSIKSTCNKAGITSTAVETKTTSKPPTSSHHHPHYISAHLGDPCTIGALDHLLHCGHKILTTHAEICASNCQASTSAFVNPRSVDRPFVCMACTTAQMKAEHDDKLCSFWDDLDLVARMTGRCGAAGWIAEKAGRMVEAWRELEVGRMEDEVAKGRFCLALWVEEEYREAYDALVARVEKSAVGETGGRLQGVNCSVEEHGKTVSKCSKIPKKRLPRCVTQV